MREVEESGWEDGWLKGGGGAVQGGAARPDGILDMLQDGVSAQSASATFAYSHGDANVQLCGVPETECLSQPCISSLFAQFMHPFCDDLQISITHM